MRIKFHLLTQKVSQLAIQPSSNSKTKLVTTADIAKPQLWQVDFSKDDPEINHIVELSGHNYNVKVLSWSPKGTYLITACDYPILWRDHGHTVTNAGKLPQEESEIHSVKWSPDEKRVIIGTQANYLFFHNIEQRQQLKKVVLDYVPVGIAWDPLDSYIGVLTTENCVTIFSSTNLEQKKKISFNIGNTKFSDINTKRIDRKIAWSSDGEYCICPSLEDKNELPIACGLNRTREFQITCVYAGPSAAITCISFLDMIFKKDKEFYSVFALGDSDGNISIWQTKGNNKPLLYIKGGYEDMSIECIDWEPHSNMIIASTTKKFIMMIQYDLQKFGTPLNEEEKKLFMENLYGKQSAVSLTTMSYLDQRRLLEMQSQQQANSFDNKMTQGPHQEENASGSKPSTMSAPTIKKIEIKRKIEPKPVENQDKEEKKVDGKEGQEGADKSVEKKDNSKIRMRPTGHHQSMDVQPVIEKVCFPKLTKGLDSYKMSILEKNILIIKTEKRVIDGSEVTYSKLSCLGTMGNNLNETFWTDIVEGKVLAIDHNSKYLVYYTDNHDLHINNIITGKKSELPLMVPNLARLKLNSQHSIMMIKENGDLRVYNFEKKEVILDENCYSLVKELNPGNPPTAENIYLDDNDIPYICLKPNLVIFYNKELKAWQKVDSGIFNFGIFKSIPKPFRNNQSSVVLMNRTPKDKFEDFMKEIAGGEVNPEKLKYDNKVTVIRKIEEAMIYAISTNDMRAYYELAGLYIRKLTDFHEFNKIRCFIIEDLLKNTNSKDYQFIKSKLKNKDEMNRFINYLKLQISSNQEIVLNLRKEIDNVMENLVFNSMFNE